MTNIIDGFLNTLEAIFVGRLNSDEVTADSLRSTLPPFFPEVNTFVQNDFENTLTFSSIIQNT